MHQAHEVVVDNKRKEDEKKESGFSPHIKKAATYQCNSIFPTQRREVVGKKKCRQKIEKENDAAEYHSWDKSMENSEILDKTIRQQKFKATLHEFGQTMLFLAVLVGYILWLGQRYLGAKEFQWKADIESSFMHEGALHFGSKDLAFSGYGLKSEAAAHSGTQSILLNKQNPYGFQAEIKDLKGNESLNIKVWRYSEHPDGKSAAIIAEVRGIVWEFKGDLVQTEPSGWEQIQLSLSLDCRTEGHTLRIYCWNPTEADVFFDDIEVSMGRPSSWE